MRQVRLKYNIPNDILGNGNIKPSDFKNHHGGKGGEPIARTLDKKYFVKRLNAQEHKSLLSVTREYCEYIEATDSLLTRVIFHINVPNQLNYKKVGLP